jgi:RNA polymerase sigma factor (sigma-70 family)
MNQFNLISEEVIREAIRGDTQAFTDIYKAYYNKVYFIAIQYFRNEEMAKDIVQEVFIRVHKNINSLREPKSFHTWIRKVTYSVCVNQSSRKLKFVDLGEDLTVEDFKDKRYKNISATVEDNRINEIIMKSIDKMDGPLKSIGMLRFYEELQLSEIAETLDIPEGTVKSRINRIKRILKEDLQNQGISPKSYSAVLLTPTMVYQAYKSLSEVYVTVVPEGAELAKIVSVQSASSGGIPLLFKAIAGGAVCAVATGVVLLNMGATEKEVVKLDVSPLMHSEKMEEEKEKIEEIAEITAIEFNQNWTNQPVYLDIQLSNGGYDEILVNGVHTNIVNENGLYVIQVIKNQEVIDEHQITITNIDTNSPTGDWSYHDDYYVLHLQDDLSQVNPTSIILYQNGIQSFDYVYDATTNTLTIPERDTQDSIYISDYADNTLMVNKEME